MIRLEKQYWHRKYEEQGKVTHYKLNPCKNLGHFPKFTSDKNKVTCTYCKNRMDAKTCPMCGKIIQR